jgi:hypothetical protein
VGEQNHDILVLTDIISRMQIFSDYYKYKLGLLLTFTLLLSVVSRKTVFSVYDAVNVLGRRLPS